MYYPFTEPKSELFLKSAMFLWDSVDFIVPMHGFRPYGETQEAEEALEMIGKSYVPTGHDKKEIHDELMDVCTSKVPNELLIPLHDPQVYNFWPQKLLPETWEMLQETNLARVTKSNDGIIEAATTPLFGYYMMSVAAVCCSKGRKNLVTDETDPYRTLANTLIDKPLSTDGSEENWHGRLIALTLGAPDLSEVPLKALVDLRKREDKLLYELRSNYVSKLNASVAEIKSNAGDSQFVAAIIESFTSTMERDLVELKRLLRRSTASMILSPMGGATILSAAVGVVAPSANIITIGALTKSLMDYQDRRHKLLREHPSAWLFAGTKEFKMY